MAKAYASDMAKNVTSEAIQVHGGYGFTDEFPVSRFYRGARHGTLGGGPTETPRALIGKRALAAFWRTGRRGRANDPSPAAHEPWGGTLSEHGARRTDDRPTQFVVAPRSRRAVDDASASCAGRTCGDDRRDEGATVALLLHGGRECPAHDGDVGRG